MGTVYLCMDGIALDGIEEEVISETDRMPASIQIPQQRVLIHQSSESQIYRSNGHTWETFNGICVLRNVTVLRQLG